MSRVLLSLLLLFATSALYAQSIGVGYYDLDGLYDTIPSCFYDDSAYTPEGKHHWSTERYNTKIDNITAVIDSMALPIVGLYGVETEDVVRDIVERSNQDYSYIHRTRNSFDGMDFALLYYGDKLFVDSVDTQHNLLIINATLSDESAITIILVRSGAYLDDYLKESELNPFVLILGNLYRSDIAKVSYCNMLQNSEDRGEGNYSSYRGWVTRDRIATNQREKILKSGIYITPWLLKSDHLSPLPTFERYNYLGGYSKYLPIFTYIL